MGIKKWAGVMSVPYSCEGIDCHRRDHESDVELTVSKGRGVKSWKG